MRLVSVALQVAILVGACCAGLALSAGNLMAAKSSQREVSWVAPPAKLAPSMSRDLGDIGYFKRQVLGSGGGNQQNMQPSSFSARAINFRQQGKAGARSAGARSFREPRAIKSSARKAFLRSSARAAAASSSSFRSTAGGKNKKFNGSLARAMNSKRAGSHVGINHRISEARGGRFKRSEPISGGSGGGGGDKCLCADQLTHKAHTLSKKHLEEDLKLRLGVTSEEEPTDAGQESPSKATQQPNPTQSDNTTISSPQPPQQSQGGLIKNEIEAKLGVDVSLSKNLPATSAQNNTAAGGQGESGEGGKSSGAFRSSGIGVSVGLESMKTTTDNFLSGLNGQGKGSEGDSWDPIKENSEDKADELIELGEEKVDEIIGELHGKFDFHKPPPALPPNGTQTTTASPEHTTTTTMPTTASPEHTTTTTISPYPTTPTTASPEPTTPTAKVPATKTTTTKLSKGPAKSPYYVYTGPSKNSYPQPPVAQSYPVYQSPKVQQLSKKCQKKKVLLIQSGENVGAATDTILELINQNNISYQTRDVVTRRIATIVNLLRESEIALDSGNQNALIANGRLLRLELTRLYKNKVVAKLYPNLKPLSIKLRRYFANFLKLCPLNAY